MNATPAEMIDRWQKRVEPAPGEGLIYWHMLLGDHPSVVAMARSAQQRLAPFTSLHMTPLKRLHMTALIAGSADEITGPQVQQMAAAASRQLAATPPITVTLGQVLYHPEAIVLAAGVWSRPLAKQLGTSVPLEAERGYHVMFAGQDFGLRRALVSADRNVSLADALHAGRHIETRFMGSPSAWMNRHAPNRRFVTDIDLKKD